MLLKLMEVGKVMDMVLVRMAVVVMVNVRSFGG